MYREIIVPSANNPVYRFPEETYGKKVEIIISDTFEAEIKSRNISIRELLKDYTFNSGGYKFNREEANDYE